MVRGSGRGRIDRALNRRDEPAGLCPIASHARPAYVASKHRRERWGTRRWLLMLNCAHKRHWMPARPEQSVCPPCFFCGSVRAPTICVSPMFLLWLGTRPTICVSPVFLLWLGTRPNNLCFPRVSSVARYAPQQSVFPPCFFCGSVDAPTTCFVLCFFCGSR